MMPTIIGEGVIPEAEAVRDVAQALAGHGDVVLLAHVAAALGQTIPAGSTIYNLEPLFDGCRSLSLGYLDVLRRFKVWDYQAPNVKYLRGHGIKAVHVPYGYSAQLERAPVRDKDIDILFVGSVSARRTAILDGIARNHRVERVQGCYGPALDEMVARAKIVLNVHYCDTPHPLEVVRLQYLMANGCFVVSERGWDERENAAYAPGLVFATDLDAACAWALNADRSGIEARARQVVRAMPMTAPLEMAEA